MDDRDENRIPLWIRKCYYAAVDDDGLKRVDHFHGEVSGVVSSGKEISIGSIGKELSGYQTCNKVAISRDVNKDPESTGSYNRISNSSVDKIREIPEQIVFNVLLWLPVITLLRLKFVCKSWRAIIQSSYFITQHLHHNSDKDGIIAKYSWALLPVYNFCLLRGNRYATFINLHFNQNWYPANEVDIVDSCNGILCLLNKESGNVALWNPALKQLRPLCHQYRPFSTVGFGFDAKSNDYKVVRVVSNGGKNLVEVYNLSTNSWRTIHNDVVLPFMRLDSSIHTSKNGTCFWLAWVDEGSYNLISFDMSDEMFETIALPCDGYHVPYALDFLNDELVHIRGLDTREIQSFDLNCEIWVLRQYGVEKSWSKMYRIGPSIDRFHPVGISKNGEFLLLGIGGCVREVGRLHMYNLWTQEGEYVKVQKPNPYVCQFIHYNESLVPVTE